MWHEHGLLPQHGLFHVHGRHEADGGGLLPPHVAVRRHLAAGGDAPAVDDHLRQAAAPHGNSPGDAGHYAAGLGRVSVHQHLVWAWCHLSVDHIIPLLELVISQKKTELILDEKYKTNVCFLCYVYT